MTIHISLPKELENLVHAQVESGMYQSASEVVREALRKFFASADNAVSPQEAAWIRDVLLPRVEEVKNGTMPLIDGDEFFKEMERRFSE